MARERRRRWNKLQRAISGAPVRDGRGGWDERDSVGCNGVFLPLLRLFFFYVTGPVFLNFPISCFPVKHLWDRVSVSVNKRYSGRPRGAPSFSRPRRCRLPSRRIARSAETGRGRLGFVPPSALSGDPCWLRHACASRATTDKNGAFFFFFFFSFFFVFVFAFLLPSS